MQISNIKYQNVIQKSKSIKNFAFYFVILIFAFCILNFSNVFAADFSLEIPQYKEGEAGKSLAGFLQWAFVVAVASAGILALLMIMIGGFQYITAGGNETRAGNAKSRIKNAIIGLILALCSYLILNTINPDLVHPSLPGLEMIEPSPGFWEDFDGGQDPAIICPPGHAACNEACDNCKDEEYAKNNPDQCDSCEKTCCIFNPNSEECRSCVNARCQDFCKKQTPPQERLKIDFDPGVCVCAKTCKDDPAICGELPCIDNKCVSENYCLQQCTKGGLQVCIEKLCKKVDNCIWFDDECIVSTPATICKSEGGIPKTGTDNCEKVCQDDKKVFAKTLRDDPNCCLCREEKKQEGESRPEEVSIYGKKWRWAEMTSEKHEEYKQSPQYKTGKRCEFLLGINWEDEQSDRCADSDIGLGPNPSGLFGNHICCSKKIE